MTFKEKIDKILETNTLKINSVSRLEDEIGAGRGAINDFYNENREPGRITIKKIKTLKGLNWKWWETGEGEAFKSAVGDGLTSQDPSLEGSDNSESQTIKDLRTTIKYMEEVIEYNKKTKFEALAQLMDAEKKIKEYEALLKEYEERVKKPV